MRYFKIWVDTPYCGTYDCQLLALEDNDKIDRTLAEEEDIFTHNFFDSFEYLAIEGIDEEDYDTYDDFEIALSDAIDEYWGGCSNGIDEISYEEF